MYCIKCGVSLADSEKHCPLCGTRVYHPSLAQKDVLPPYPRLFEEGRRMNRPLIMLIITILLGIVALQLLTFDLRFSGALSWSYYAAGGIFAAYFIFLFPFWFQRPNPVVLVPVDFAVVGVYLLGVDLLTKGGWFLPFALPLLLIAAAITSAVVTLLRYTPRGVFYILGGALIAMGLYCALLENLIYVVFSAPSRFVFWSLYPLTGLALLGLLLILIGIVAPLRERLEKKLFL